LVLVTVQGINWCLSLLSLLEEAIRKNLTEWKAFVKVKLPFTSNLNWKEGL
jgi:hypothetical protein